MTHDGRPSDPEQGPTDDLRIALSRIARQLRQATDDGLTPSAMSILNVITARGAIKLSELAAIERVAAPTITKIVDGLVSGGLLERKDDPGDRRACLVQLTPIGKTEMKRLRVERNRRLEHLIDQLDEADQVALAASIPALVRLSETRP
jgi:DNA-binding MarR family transcriptional regulator